MAIRLSDLKRETIGAFLPFDKKEFTVTSGQTSFDIGKNFDLNTTMVFLNSAMISSWTKSGNNVVIVDALEGDNVDVILNK